MLVFFLCNMDKLGERIRKRREYLGISMKVLAKGISVSPSLLSQIENGKAFPSLHTIKHIADFLNSSVGALIGENETFSQFPIVSWDDKKFVKTTKEGASLFLLAHYSPMQTMEIYLLELQPGATTKDILDISRKGQEFCFMLDGNAEIRLKNETLLFPSRSGVYFYSHELDKIENTTNEVVKIIWIISPLKT